MLTRLIGLVRVAVGLVVVTSPKTAAKLFALPGREINASAQLLSRLTGNRELVLGAALLLLPEEQAAPWLGASIMVDVADAGVSLWAMRDGLSRRAALQSAVAGSSYAALEAFALGRIKKH